MKYIQCPWYNINVAQYIRSLFNMSLLNRRLWWQGRRSCANQKTHSDAESRGWTEQRSLYPEDLVSQIHQIHGLRTLLKKENTVICELWQSDDLDTTGDSLEEGETLACSSNLVQQAQIQKIFKENCKFERLYLRRHDQPERKVSSTGGDH